MARTNKTTRPKKAPAAPSPAKRAVAAAPVKVNGTGSAIQFDVHSGLQEIQDFARQQGWPDKGWTQMSIPWQELVYTADGWKTVNTLKSSEAPTPFAGGRIHLTGVAAGTEIEFALHVGVSSQAPGDAGEYRERGDVWLNNGGRNYRQVTK